MNQDEFDGILPKYNELKELLGLYKNSYYLTDSPLASDAKYDELFHNLLDLEAKYPELITESSPSQTVGSPIESTFQSIIHPSKMYSLNDVFSKEDINKWATQILANFPQSEFLMETKIDGLAVNLVYEKGILTHCETRGDGVQGEDLTANGLVVSGINASLNTDSPPDFLEVRGEVFITKKDFEDINQQIASENIKLKEAGKKQKSLLANARNAAAGSFRQKDISETRKRKLSFLAHGIGILKFGDDNSKSITKQSEIYTMLENWGIPIISYRRLVKTLPEITETVDEFSENRDNYLFDIDGIAVKVDDFETQTKIGFTSRFPKWAIAYKFPAQEVWTKLLDIQVQIGRTGKITPFAIMESVLVDGSIVARATLHNIEDIIRKGILIGDIVVLRKAGDIIPEVISFVESEREKLLQENCQLLPFQMPKNCPSCNTPLRKESETDVDLRCPNFENCLAQLQERLKYIASRSVLDIEIMGGSAVSALTSGENPVLKSEAGLFDLQIENLPKFFYNDPKLSEAPQPSKNTLKMLEQIQKSKTRDFYRKICAMCIRNVGNVTARLVASNFPDINSLENAKFEELSEIDGIGPKIAQNIVDWFKQDSKIEILQTWKNAGFFEGDNASITKIENSEIAGKVFVLTGKLESLTREELENLIMLNGGRTSSSVSKKTDFVIAGENPGSKLDKAQSLEIAIIDEPEILRMLNGK